MDVKPRLPDCVDAPHRMAFEGGEKGIGVVHVMPNA
jgi:hypothetical protein